MTRNLTIDARWLDLGGLGTYAYHLIEGLAQQENGFDVRAIVNRRSAGAISSFCKSAAIADASAYTLREQFEVLRAAKGCDLLHVPHYNVPVLFRGRLLVSICDLIHTTDPTYSRTLGSWLYARPMLHLAAHRAEHVITLSEYSKTQIVERLGVPSSKVTAIYCGVSSQFHSVEREQAIALISKVLGIREPYLLYIGNLKPHKNVSTLLHAFALLRKRSNMPQRLLIIGDDARWGAARREEASKLGIGNATQFVPRVAEELLPAVYTAAELLVMPSKLEGFGLPVLEAMACGTPVVCSQSASLPEVGGDAVVYFDPEDKEALADAMERVLNSSELQGTLRSKGVERAKQFGWEESTRKHVELYRRLLGLN